MKHQLSLEAAAAYATLLNEYVDYDERDNFSKDFEKFLDAYAGDSKPDKTQTVENFQREVNEQRDIPKVGEIYKDLFGRRYQIVAVFNEACVATSTIEKPFNESVIQFGSLYRFKTSDLTKED